MSAFDELIELVRYGNKVSPTIRDVAISDHKKMVSELAQLRIDLHTVQSELNTAIEMIQSRDRRIAALEGRLKDIA